MITKVFQSGNSQAVRIPKEFQLSTPEVEICQQGDTLLLIPVYRNLQEAYVAWQKGGALSPDCFEERLQPEPQERV